MEKKQELILIMLRNLGNHFFAVTGFLTKKIETMERQFLTFEKNLVTKRRQRKKRKRIKSHTADYHN